MFALTAGGGEGETGKSEDVTLSPSPPTARHGFPCRSPPPFPTDQSSLALEARLNKDVFDANNSR